MRRALRAQGQPVTLAVAGRANSAPWIAAPRPLRGGELGHRGRRRVGRLRGDQPRRGRDLQRAGPGEPRRRRGPRRRRDPAAGGAARAAGRHRARRGRRLECQGHRAPRSSWPDRSDGGASFGAPVSLQSAGAAGDRGWHALALDDQGVGARAVARSSRPGGAEGGAKAGEHAAAAGEHDGVRDGADGRACTTRVRARASADRADHPRASATAARRPGRADRRRLVSAWRHVYAGNLRDIAFIVSRDGGAIVRATGACQRGRLGDQRLSGRWPRAGRRCRRRVAHRVADRDSRRRAGRRALLRADAGRRAASPPRVRIPTLGSPKPSHPQVAVDGTGRLFVAWDESIEGVRTAAYTVADRRRRRRPLRRADAPGVGRADAVPGDGAAGAGRGRRLDRGPAGSIDDSREAPGGTGRGDRAHRR